MTIRVNKTTDRPLASSMAIGGYRNANVKRKQDLKIIDLWKKSLFTQIK